MWLQPDTKQSGPLLIANLSLDPEWEFVPTEALPACCMPADMPYDASCMLKVTGPAEPILMAALRRGARLTLYQLKAIVVAFSIAVPAQGSGKGGRCIKIDFIRAVLAHFFATEMTPEQQAETASKILGKKPADSPETDTPELHLKLLAQLDASEAPQFAVMKKVAVDALAEEALKAKVKKPGKAKATEHVPTADDIAEAEAAETVEKEKPTFETRASGTHVKAPREFRSLLPPNLDYIYFHWEPQSRRVAVEFKSFLASKCRNPHCHLLPVALHKLVSPGLYAGYDWLTPKLPRNPACLRNPEPPEEQNKNVASRCHD